MLIRPIREDEKDLYNSVVEHPIQTWEWGQFRKQTGKKVEHLGFFENGQIKKALLVTFRPVPKFKQYSVGYCARGFRPDEDQISALKQLGAQHNALFIKIEPNVTVPAEDRAELKPLIQKMANQGFEPGRPYFAKHTFQVDLTLSEDELFSNLKSKTRYNVKLAQKKGVKIIEDNSKQGLEIYIEILQEILDRKGFYLHSPEYFRNMWQTLQGTDIMHIFHAVYDDTSLVSWVLFKWQDMAYYPYGASRDLHREVMPSNLMMWELLMWAKKQGAKTFDMWGSLGPNPDKNNPWYGFHRFKKGYGGDLMRFVGTYDLVLQQPHYKLFRLVDNLRWKYLRAKNQINNFL